MAQLRVGIIGTGQIADTHVKGFVESDHATVAAVCDVQEDLAVERALEWGADRYFTDYRELIAYDGVDAVVIVTPHDQHAVMAMAAINAGKHVQVARPLALTVADADAIVAAAARRKVIVAVCEPDLYANQLTDAQSYLEGGEIGQGLSVSIRGTVGAPEGGWNIRPESWLWRFDPQRSGGGPFLFDTIHSGLLSAAYLLGPIALVEARIGRTEVYPGYYVDAPATVQWQHHNGAVGSLMLTYSPEMFVKSDFYPTDLRFEVTGTRGMMGFNMAPGRLDSISPLAMYRDGRVFGFGEIDQAWDGCFKRAAEGFIAEVLEGAAPVCDASAGRAQVATTIAAFEASRTQRPQAIK